MRLPRPRFTLRRLMVAVAVAGVAFGLFDMRNRSSAYCHWAIGYGNLARLYRYGILDIAANEDAVRTFDELRIKYERAARFPWLPVAPDPPPQMRRRRRLAGLKYFSPVPP